MPGTIRNASGILVAPERRMSSCVITNTAAAASASFWLRLDTEVTCMFIRSSMLIAVTSGISVCWGSAAKLLGTSKSATSTSASACLIDTTLWGLLGSILTIPSCFSHSVGCCSIRLQKRFLSRYREDIGISKSVRSGKVLNESVNLLSGFPLTSEHLSDLRQGYIQL